MRPRTFELVRHRDPSGVSGTGVVAEGCVFTDGSVALRWRGTNPATAVWPDLDSVLAVHGHQGATEVRWTEFDQAGTARPARPSLEPVPAPLPARPPLTPSLEPRRSPTRSSTLEPRPAPTPSGSLEAHATPAHSGNLDPRPTPTPAGSLEPRPTPARTGIVEPYPAPARSELSRPAAGRDGSEYEAAATPHAPVERAPYGGVERPRTGSGELDPLFAVQHAVRPPSSLADPGGTPAGHARGWAGARHLR